MDLGTAMVSVLGAALAGGGVSYVIQGLMARPKTRAEAGKTDAERVATLTDSALDIVAQLKADTVQARQEVREVRQEAREARQETVQARQELGKVRREAELLGRELRRLRLAILDPDATLERLRAMVGDDPGNGVTAAEFAT